jgi:hypothetical protein
VNRGTTIQEARIPVASHASRVTAPTGVFGVTVMSDPAATDAARIRRKAGWRGRLRSI